MYTMYTNDFTIYSAQKKISSKVNPRRILNIYPARFPDLVILINEYIFCLHFLAITLDLNDYDVESI